MESQPEKSNKSKTKSRQRKLKTNSCGKDSKNSSSSSSSSSGMSDQSKKTEDSIEKSSCVEHDSTTMAPRSFPHVDCTICAICLEPKSDESFIENCPHSFCFFCLKEWSKMTPRCPLCKEKFFHIKHNIQGDSSEEYIVPNTNDGPPDDRSEEVLFLDDLINFLLQQQAQRSTRSSYTMRYLPPTVIFIFQQLLTFSRVPTRFRQRVYEDNLWVKVPQRLRLQLETAAFYRNEITRALKLIPWLVREIASLFSDDNELVTSLLKLIMKLIFYYDITSTQFQHRLEPYMGHNVSHFIHEFSSFAISSYPMDMYDVLASYGPPFYHALPSPSNASIVMGNGSNVSLPPNPDLSTRGSTQQGNNVPYRVISAKKSGKIVLQSSIPFVSNENMPGSSTSGFEASHPEIIELSSDEDEPVPMIRI